MSESEAKGPQFVVMALYLSSAAGNDFGSIHAMDYGIDRLFEHAIRVESRGPVEHRKDFNWDSESYAFDDEASARCAIGMAQAAVGHSGSDHRKHRDVRYRLLSKEEKEVYDTA